MKRRYVEILTPSNREKGLLVMAPLRQTTGQTCSRQVPGLIEAHLRDASSAKLDHITSGSFKCVMTHVG